jgi:hypothetical protein
MAIISLAGPFVVVVMVVVGLGRDGLAAARERVHEP